MATFLIIVDVGYSIETYSDFSGTGKAYVPFPDSLTHRVLLSDLDRQGIRERLPSGDISGSCS